MGRPNTPHEIEDAAEDILARLRELNGPKDAVCAILTAHVKLTLDHHEKPISEVLDAYTAAFKDAIGS